jgi:hypothetical protein
MARKKPTETDPSVEAAPADPFADFAAWWHERGSRLNPPEMRAAVGERVEAAGYPSPERAARRAAREARLEALPYSEGGVAPVLEGDDLAQVSE